MHGVMSFRGMFKPHASALDIQQPDGLRVKAVRKPSGPGPDGAVSSAGLWLGWLESLVTVKITTPFYKDTFYTPYTSIVRRCCGTAS